MSSSRADYAPSRPLEKQGPVVSAVEPNSPADRAGLLPGVVIETVEGCVPRDEIDWLWLSEGSEIELTVSKDGSREVFDLAREFGEGWGVSFSTPLFDGVKTCKNSCTFCFMTQLPKGMRPALYVRDDDYRLSFSQGNFVTLTNLEDEDVARIIEQRLSPLHVSVHAIDAHVRERLIGKNHARGLTALQEITDAGIEVHAQIVLVPGVNDGTVLEETLESLLRIPAVLSVGIVPLGFTRYQKRFTKSYDDPADARSVIELVAPFQIEQRQTCHVTRVQLADEFYLDAGLPLPPATHYDGFPQYEDGIGMVRTYCEDASTGRPELIKLNECYAKKRTSDLFLLTGELFAPVLRSVLDSASEQIKTCEKTPEHPGIAAPQVVAVKNDFFGGNVNVAGLLCGEDILHAIERVVNERARAHRAGEHKALFCLPDVVFNADGLTLDGYSLEQLRNGSSERVCVVSCTFDGILQALGSALE